MSTRQELRSFSKERGQEVRTDAFRKIREHRQTYFNRKKEALEEIDRLKEEGRGKENNLREVLRRSEELKGEIEEKRAGLLIELLSYFVISEKSKELSDLEIARREISDDVVSIYQRITELEGQLQDRRELEEAETELSFFYEGQSQEWAGYQEELRTRDVKNIARDQQVVFVHGIHPQSDVGMNTFLKPGVDWRKKLDIFLSFQPTASTSTIRKGDNWTNMYVRMGVLLRGGMVTSASRRDGGTRATSLKGRTDVLSGTKLEAKEEIDRAVNQRIGNYNELVVRDPEVAGLYVCLDDTGNTIVPDMVHHQEIKQKAEQLGLPVFVILNGEVYEAEYSEKGYQTGQKISPEALVARDDFDFNGQKKAMMIKGILEDSPFKLEIAEVAYIDSLASGQQDYIELNFSRKGDLEGEFYMIGFKIVYTTE